MIPVQYNTARITQPVCTRRCTYPRCAWRGPALWSHWSLAHGGALIGGRHTLDVPVRSPTKGLARGVAITRLLRTRGRLFALHLRRRPGEASLLGCVQLLGARPSARSFLYRLEVLDGEDRATTSVMSEVTVSDETPIVNALQALCEVASKEQSAQSNSQPPTAPNSLRVKVNLRESPFARRRSKS
ncbi:uncharacterized protein LOC127750414 [Frankliniella occidentalis]|uniref:Uncharacterized protein LOC127750414 n=1 Tax=Frankliniella occidentalis TaxID=133901 RepID=A0A9C6X2U3_FRAOC|nr:uncharacterized protein LOC127750414 [Frankliniella occidentalis]